jgi:hypothetical protein
LRPCVKTRRESSIQGFNSAKNEVGGCAARHAVRGVLGHAEEGQGGVALPAPLLQRLHRGAPAQAVSRHAPPSGSTFATQPFDLIFYFPTPQLSISPEFHAHFSKNPPAHFTVITVGWAYLSTSFPHRTSSHTASMLTHSHTTTHLLPPCPPPLPPSTNFNYRRPPTATTPRHTHNSNHHCPTCRLHVPSRRALRDDPEFDAVIAALYGNAGDYDMVGVGTLVTWTILPLQNTN